jgi:hypothetical protein
LPQGFNVGVNCGDAAGQTVNHAHIHVGLHAIQNLYTKLEKIKIGYQTCQTYQTYQFYLFL